MTERPDLAVIMFDYVPSGVVLNALRIAGAAHRAGLRTEIWTAQQVGEMIHTVLPGITVRNLGLSLGEVYKPRARKLMLGRMARPLARLLSEIRPRILLSAGNHFHTAAVAAVSQLNREESPRVIGRVSNALPRFSWNPIWLPSSIKKRLVARKRYRSMQRLIAVSEQLRRDLQTKLLVDPSKIVVVPNGIDLGEVERLASEPVDHPWFGKDADPVLVTAGRLTHQKGFDLLLRAFALAQAQRPMKLIILGDGPKKTKLEKLARKLGIAAHVAFAGHVSNPVSYFRRADLFVLPSRWEGLSNALLEAFAAGTPVVATRCPGSVELLGDGAYGSLVDVGDVEALSQAVVAALEKPHSRASQLQRAKDYDLASTLDAYVRIIREELAKTGVYEPGP